MEWGKTFVSLHSGSEVHTAHSWVALVICKYCAFIFPSGSGLPLGQHYGRLVIYDIKSTSGRGGLS